MFYNAAYSYTIAWLLQLSLVFMKNVSLPKKYEMTIWGLTFITKINETI